MSVRAHRAARVLAAGVLAAVACGAGAGVATRDDAERPSDDIARAPVVVAATGAASSDMSKDPGGDARVEARELACERAPPAGFVSLRARAPAVRLDIRYHRADNFTGAPLPGYGAPGAWLTPASADALAAAQRELAEEGLGLVVFDAYRPTRASRAMVAWAEAHGREELLGDYVARRSGHARGHTVDVGLVSLKSGEPLDMGGEFDAFDRVSHTRAASGAALERRLRLRAAMQARGFAPYEREWWHFRHSSPGLPARDVPYGCDEDAPERRP